MKINMFDIEIERLLQVRWDIGQTEYRSDGGDFVGDPWEELYEELLDGVNYAREANRSTKERGLAQDVESTLLELLVKIRNAKKSKPVKHSAEVLSVDK